MPEPQLILYEEEHGRIQVVIDKLALEASAKAVFLVDKNGQLVAETGELRGIDTTSLASLTAGNIAATGGLAKIIGEEEFPTHFHQGDRDNLHITLIARRIILVIVFENDKSSLGLVRLRVKKASSELAHIFEEMQKKAEAAAASGADSPFAEITDDDIDNLFSD